MVTKPQVFQVKEHILRLYDMKPSTSTKSPEMCEHCRRFYNDEDHKKTVILCCLDITLCLLCAIEHWNDYQCLQRLNLKSCSDMICVDLMGEEDAIKNPEAQDFEEICNMESNLENFSCDSVVPECEILPLNEMDTPSKSKCATTLNQPNEINISSAIKKLIPRHHRSPIVLIVPLIL